MSTRTALTGLEAALARLPHEADLAVVRDGPDTIIALEPAEVVTANGADAFSELDRLDDGWWAGFCAYDLGRTIERVPDRNASDGLPDVLFARFDARIVIDATGAARVEGTGPGRARLERLLDDEPAHAPAPPLRDWRSSLDRTQFQDAVREIHRYLVRGDCYQVNLTRRLQCDVAAEPVTLFRSLLSGNPAPHAALVRIGDVAVVSASPERFLRRDGSHIETRPIKGTSSDPDALAASAKDRAENVMIVDLARNDLGRVCEYGSVKVPALFEVEQHPGLYHLVSTVAGTLRADVKTGDFIRATFPPASVTGCPKPRVLQIIEELEPVRRGVYCGAIGFIDGDRDVLDLNVAIRTFVIAGGRTTLGVGSGIVADSDPSAEWTETELKAQTLLEIARGTA